MSDQHQDPVDALAGDGGAPSADDAHPADDAAAAADDAAGSTGGAGALFDRLRASLETEHDQLEAQIDGLGDTGEAAAFDDEGFADSGQVAAEQGESRALAGRLREQLDDVERALERLDAGTYGACEVCGDAIGDDRLEVMPATRWCREHAR